MTAPTPQAPRGVQVEHETYRSQSEVPAKGDDRKETEHVLRIMYDRLRRFLEIQLQHDPAFLARQQVTEVGQEGGDSRFLPPLPAADKNGAPQSLANYAKVVCGLIDMVTYFVEEDAAAKGELEGTPDTTPFRPFGVNAAAVGELEGTPDTTPLRPAGFNGPCGCKGKFEKDKRALEIIIESQKKSLVDKETAINEMRLQLSNVLTDVENARYQTEHHRNLMSKYKEKCDELEKAMENAKQDKNPESDFLTKRIVSEIKKQEELHAKLQKKDLELAEKTEEMEKLMQTIINRNEKIKGLMEQVDQLEETLDTTTAITKHPLDPYSARRLLLERPQCAQSPIYEISPEQDESEVAEAIAEGKASALKRLDGNLRAIVAQWPGILADPPFGREDLRGILGFYYPSGRAPPRDWYTQSLYQITRAQGTRMPRELGCKIGNERHEPYRIMLDDLRAALSGSGLPAQTPPSRRGLYMDDEEINSGDRLYMISCSRSVSPEIKSKRSAPVPQVTQPVPDAITTINTTDHLPPDFVQDTTDHLAQDRERRIRARRALHVVLPRDVAKIHRLRQEEGLDRAEAQSKTPEELAHSRAERQQELARKIETAREVLRDGSHRRASTEMLPARFPDINRAMYIAKPPTARPIVYDESASDVEPSDVRQQAEGYLGDREISEDFVDERDEEYDEAGNRKRKRPVKIENEITPSPEHFQARHRDLYLRHQQSAELRDQNWQEAEHGNNECQAQPDETDVVNAESSAHPEQEPARGRQRFNVSHTQPRTQQHLLGRDKHMGSHLGGHYRPSEDSELHSQENPGFNFLQTALSNSPPAGDPALREKYTHVADAYLGRHGSGRLASYYPHPARNMTPDDVAAHAQQIVEATMRPAPASLPPPPPLHHLLPGAAPKSQKEPMTGGKVHNPKFQGSEGADSSKPYGGGLANFTRANERDQDWAVNSTTNAPSTDDAVQVMVNTAQIANVHPPLTPPDRLRKPSSGVVKDVVSAVLETQDPASAIGTAPLDEDEEAIIIQQVQEAARRLTKVEQTDIEEESVETGGGQQSGTEGAGEQLLRAKAEIASPHEADGEESSRAAKAPTKRLRSAPKKSSSGTMGTKKARKNVPVASATQPEPTVPAPSETSTVGHVTRSRAAAGVSKGASQEDNTPMSPVAVGKGKSKAVARRRKGSDDESTGAQPSAVAAPMPAAPPPARSGRLARKGSAASQKDAQEVSEPQSEDLAPTSKAVVKRKGRKGSAEKDIGAGEPILSEGSAEPPSAATEPATSKTGNTAVPRATRTRQARKASQQESEAEPPSAVVEPASEATAPPVKAGAKAGAVRRGRKGSADNNAESETEPKSEAVATASSAKAVAKAPARRGGKKAAGGDATVGEEPAVAAAKSGGAKSRALGRKGSAISDHPSVSESDTSAGVTVAAPKTVARKGSSSARAKALTQPEQLLTVDINEPSKRAKRTQGRGAAAAAAVEEAEAEAGYVPSTDLSYVPSTDLSAQEEAAPAKKGRAKRAVAKK